MSDIGMSDECKKRPQCVGNLYCACLEREGRAMAEKAGHAAMKAPSMKTEQT